MRGRASDIAARLAERAEEVCLYYLSNGRRSGNYWHAGNVENAKGQSLWVRIRGRRHLVGRWRDEAETDCYGDLLDLIRLNGGYASLSEAMAEAERFLGLAPRRAEYEASHLKPQSTGADAARHLFARGRPVRGTFGEDYLASRGLAVPPYDAVRFLADAMFIGDDGARRSGPALLAAIRDRDGIITGVHRTFLATSVDGPLVLSTPFFLAGPVMRPLWEKGLRRCCHLPAFSTAFVFMRLYRRRSSPPGVGLRMRACFLSPWTKTGMARERARPAN